MHSFVKRKWGL